jgi:transposase
LANTPPIRRLFLKTELEPRLAEARCGQRKVFFVDAAHFVLASFLGWLWCRTRLFVKAASGRQRYNVLGAFNAVSGELIRVTNTSYITAQTVCELLNKIAKLGLNTPITLVLDNARYQRCQLVQQLADTLKIELLFLPSYSPNLNLIERLWKFVKKTALNSRYQGSFTEFQGAIDRCLDELPTTHRPQISTLMATAFQTFGDVSMLPA